MTVADNSSMTNKFVPQLGLSGCLTSTSQSNKQRSMSTWVQTQCTTSFKQTYTWIRSLCTVFFGCWRQSKKTCRWKQWPHCSSSRRATQTTFLTALSLWILDQWFEHSYDSKQTVRAYEFATAKRGYAVSGKCHTECVWDCLARFW